LKELRPPEDPASGDAAPGTVGDARLGAMSEPARHQLSPHAVEWYRDYVYGTIATLVAIGGLTFEYRPDPLSAGGVVIVGAVAIWLAHAVSHLVADWAAQEQPFTVRTVLARLRQSSPIVSAAIPATAVVALSWTGIWSVSTGLWVGEGVGVVALAAVGVLTAGGSQRAPGLRILYVVVLVVVGLFIVGLEVGAHHL
jgi:hypothetical protein